MITIEVNPQVRVGIDEIISGASSLATPELERFSRQIAQLVSQRREREASKREAFLLAKIREPLLLPPAQRRYDLLFRKLQQEKISEPEHQELSKLIQQNERKGLERLKCLIELAQVRSVSLEEVMSQLGMKAVNPKNA